MLRNMLFCGVMIMVLAGCGGKVEERPLPTDTPVLPTRTPAPSSTPRVQNPTNTPSPTRELPTPTEQISSPTPAPLPDLSGVRLYEVTHLMDPSMFQVSMDGWPADMPEGVIVRVGLEFYTCEILFPEQFPNRVYCWGKAPPKGTEVKIQVILEDVPQPLLEIPFRVPYPIQDDN